MSNSWLNPLVNYYKIFFGEKANIIIDVGTRDGDDAFFLQQLLNANEIYTIDAREKAVQETINKYPNFKTFHTAIANYDGFTQFCEVISEDKDYAGSSSISNYKFSRPEYEHIIIEIPVLRMKTFMDRNDLYNKVIDIIKIDIEGYTAQFLYSMDQYIYNVKMFHMETEKNATHKDHRNSADVASYMREKGFMLVATQYEWGEEIEDQIWVNKKFLEKKHYG